MNYSEYLTDDAAPIFLLHGVIEKQVNPVRNYTRKHVEKDYFAGFLNSLLKAGGRPLSLDEWIVHHREGRPLPPRSFVITFDDGFQNNLTVAAPTLADFNVPATFYVTTGFVEENRMSWVDRIEYALEPAPPGKLKLPWGERQFIDDASKRLLMEDIRANAKTTPSLHLDDFATDMQVQLGMTPTWSSDDQLDQKLTWDEVNRLACGVFSVGTHSHSHPIMAYLTPAALDGEVSLSLDLMAKNAGISARHYSYPEGLAHCYSPAVIRTLKSYGVICCPTAEHGLNSHTTDLFLLKRIFVV